MNFHAIKTEQVPKLYRGYIPPDTLSALDKYRMECFANVVQSGLPKQEMMEEFRKLGVKSPEKLGIVKHLFE